MDRRRFLDMTARGGAFAAAWATTGMAGTRLLAAVPRPATTARKLIIPTDTPDRFKVKVMEFNPILAPDPATWELEIGGLVDRPVKLKLADIHRLSRIKQSSRIKCVQCWSARVEWEGFRSGDLLKLARPKREAT